MKDEVELSDLINGLIHVITRFSQLIRHSPSHHQGGRRELCFECSLWSSSGTRLSYMGCPRGGQGYFRGSRDQD